MKNRPTLAVTRKKKKKTKLNLKKKQKINQIGKKTKIKKIKY